MSNRELEIRSDLQITPQKSGKSWKFVIEDPIHRRFFRVGLREYLIASSLNGKRNLDQVLAMVQDAAEEEAVTPEFLQKTIRWLASNHLLKNGDASSILKNTDDSLYRPSGDPFSFKVALLSADTLHTFAASMTWMVSKSMAVVAALCMCTAISLFALNSNFYRELGAKLFVPEAMLWWLGAWLVLKAVHEMGHAVFCVASRGSLRSAGLAFVYLAPVPFVDTTDMWKLADRKSRILCACGGMLAELFLASIATIVCMLTESQSIQYFCITIATLGTFTTVAFNANPLVRFDGYYLLSDLLDRPNLWTEGTNAFQKVLQFFTVRGAIFPSFRTFPLVAYGFGCGIYRLMILFGLAWGAWSTWHGIGVVLICVATYLWFIRPWIMKSKQAKMLPPSNSKWSYRRISTVSIFGLLVAGMACVVPSPWQPRSPGAIQYTDPTVIRSGADGIVSKVLVSEGQIVNTGQPLLTIENSKLILSRDTLRLDLELAREKSSILRASNRLSEGQAELAKVAAMEEQLAQLDEQVNKLTLLAPSSGRFLSRKLNERVGQFLKLGQAIGWIVDDQHLELVGSVVQEEADIYRESVGREVAIHTLDGQTHLGTIKEVLPTGTDILDNITLAANYGGPVTVRMEKDSQHKSVLRTDKPRFVAHISIADQSPETLAVGQWCSFQLSDRQATLMDVFLRFGKSFLNHMTASPEVN